MDGPVLKRCTGRDFFLTGTVRVSYFASPSQSLRLVAIYSTLSSTDGTWSGVRDSPSLVSAHDPASRFRLLARHRSGFQALTECAQAHSVRCANEKTPFMGVFSFAQRTGLEPATSRVTGGCSNQLSYHCKQLHSSAFGSFFQPGRSSIEPHQGRRQDPTRCS